MPRRIETLFLAGPAGRLEALLEEPEDADPLEAAVVCHPHPQGGGTMHNKVVYRLARGLRKTGCVVLRFNYRGVNLSEGEYMPRYWRNRRRARGFARIGAPLSGPAAAGGRFLLRIAYGPAPGVTRSGHSTRDCGRISHSHRGARFRIPSPRPEVLRAQHAR